MPLSPPTYRELMHRRSVQCHGYRREDGLWDIEGPIVDTKTNAFQNRERGDMKPADPGTEATVSGLLVDGTDWGPFSVCPAICDRFKMLKGLRIGRGWRRKINELVGGINGCTHLVELLGPVATTAFQTIYPIKARRKDAQGEKTKPLIIDSCHALARDSEVFQRHWPQFYSGPRTQVNE